MTAALTLEVGGRLYLLPIDRCGPVFRVGALTRVPLTAPDIAGLTNQRGKTLAIVNLARRFSETAPPPGPAALAVTVEAANATYAVVVDAVGDVIDISADEAIEPPARADPARAGLTSALFRRGGEVMALLDVERLFEPENPAGAP